MGQGTAGRAQAEHGVGAPGPPAWPGAVRLGLGVTGLKVKWGTEADPNWAQPLEAPFLQPLFFWLTLRQNGAYTTCPTNRSSQTRVCLSSPYDPQDGPLSLS